ncbi:uncharacterized protein LOC111352722 [Spodoptera litura]|uniref:Uncharacterized protein LOC111352722 n=1 Tax=Spodoptera litura TaxID=69820 RepID=A0A9J7IN08_SPOLT|nr:uncharacterized protein LOC111352722 [Spodoptera litura]
MAEQMEDAETSSQVAGDVIGNTAYSERFVLKILLNFANLDRLKEELEKQSFVDDICVLWDMTMEKDVVLFLQKHEVLKLINFALPVIETSKIIDVIIGIIGNMCCHKEVVSVLMKMDDLLSFMMYHINTDESLVLIQLLRLVSGCLFLANDEEMETWMNLFVTVDYSSALYFILKNSSHLDLLFTALENLNSLCSYCNTEKFREKFYTLFVVPDALDCLTAAFTEMAVNNKATCSKIRLERIFFISLQIVLNFVEFTDAYEMFEGSKESVITLINVILVYYEDKLVVKKEIDLDLIDILMATSTIVMELKLTGLPEKYFEPSYNMWKATWSILHTDKDGSSFEESDKEELKDFVEKVKYPLALIICNYFGKMKPYDFYRFHLEIDRVQSIHDEMKRWLDSEPVETDMSSSRRVKNRRSRRRN